MRLKIASYNVRKAVGRDRRRDPARILNVIAEIDADVVVLQEADRRLGARPTAIPRALIEQRTDYQIADLSRNDVSLGWHGNAVLVRKGIEITATQHIDLPGLEPRGAVLVGLGGVSVVGAHLGLLRRWRRLQMRAILDHVGPAARRTVIAGDFNEWSDLHGCEPLEKDFTIVYPGPTFPTLLPVASLDAMAYGSEISVEEHGVMRAAAARVASDHLPIWATMRLVSR
jgi:endonuclease/exonuclease/phosphatase family metal-dependent hydrolase